MQCLDSFSGIIAGTKAISKGNNVVTDGPHAISLPFCPHGLLCSSITREMGSSVLVPPLHHG